MSYDVVWPRTPRAIEAIALAPRMETLAGKRLCFAWDYVFSGDKIWDLLKEGLTARYADMEFIEWDVIGNIHGPNERQIEHDMGARMKELGVDALIVGMGC